VDDFAILFVEPPDFNQVARVGTITCDELRHYRHWFQSVDSELRTTTIK
jgi:hypothetical protein